MLNNNPVILSDLEKKKLEELSLNKNCLITGLFLDDVILTISKTAHKIFYISDSSVNHQWGNILLQMTTVERFFEKNIGIDNVVTLYGNKKISLDLIPFNSLDLLIFGSLSNNTESENNENLNICSEKIRQGGKLCFFLNKPYHLNDLDLIFQNKIFSVESFERLKICTNIFFTIGKIMKFFNH